MRPKPASALLGAALAWVGLTSDARALGSSPPAQGALPPITAANAAKVKQVAVLQGHTMPVFGLAFSPDGKSLASAGIDKSVRVWDAQTGKQTARFEHQQQAIAVAFSPDGSTLVSAGYDKAIRLWDLNTQKQVEEQKQNPKDELQRPEIGTCYTEFNPEGSVVAYTTDGPDVHLWDVKAKSQRDLNVPRNFNEFHRRMAWSADGKWLAIQYEFVKEMKTEVRVWSVREGKWAATLSGDARGFFASEAIALNSDGSNSLSAHLGSDIFEFRPYRMS